MQKARTKLNMTQKQLANATALPVSIINDYEKGNGVRVGSNTSKIKKVLNI
jgi:ribosome-binding protein aMBF1 (putative translation factor)